MSKNSLLEKLDALTPNNDKVADRLAEMQKRGSRSRLIWKPTGRHTIRILPYPHQTDNDPIVQIFFHWDVDPNKANLVCPVRTGLGERCPICELVRKLWDMGTQDSEIIARKIGAKARYYVPVIVRGEEEEGVKFYPFGKDVRDSIASFVEDPEYPDIFDPIKGFDWTINYTPPKKDESGKIIDWGIRDVKPRRTESPIFEIVEGKEKEIVEKMINIIEGIPNLFEDEFQARSYEELYEIIKLQTPEVLDDGKPDQYDEGTKDDSRYVDDGIEGVDDSDEKEEKIDSKEDLLNATKESDSDSDEEDSEDLFAQLSKKFKSSS